MSVGITAAVIGGGAAIGAAVISSKGNSASNNANNAAASADQEQAQIAQNEWDDYATNFQPLEGKFVGQVNNWTSPQNYDKAAGDAAASVNSQYGAAKASLERTPGMDPSSGAYQAGMTNLGLSQAATSATQQNAARQNVQNQGIAMQENALSLGKGLPATAEAGLSSAASGLTNVSNTAYNQNARTSSSIGGAINTVANGVTNYLNTNYGSTGSSASGSENTGASSTSTPDDLIAGYTSD